MTNTEAADKMDGAAESYLTMYGESENQKMILADAEDLRKIGQLIRSNEIAEAKQKVYNLDTIVREVIPESVWVWLGMG